MTNGLLSVDETLGRLLEGARPVNGTETVPTLAATGRVLAQAQTSTLDVPPLDNTSMDGYAVRSADCVSGAARLRISQRIAATPTPFPASTCRAPTARWSGSTPSSSSKRPEALPVSIVSTARCSN